MQMFVRYAFRCRMPDIPEVLCPSCGVEMKINSCDGEISYHCASCDTQDSDQQLTKSARKNCCAICGKSFTQFCNLKRHVLVSHSENRPFLCECCNKGFKTKGALKRHNVIHTGELPFECSTCKRRFNQISNLRKHALIHSNNCPYYCSVCEKGFHQMSNLKKHHAVHEKHEECRNLEDSPEEVDLEKSGGRPVLTFVRAAT